MKQLIKSVVNKKTQLFSQPQMWTASPVFAVMMFFSILLFSSCTKQETTTPVSVVQSKANDINKDQELLTYYNGLDFQTLAELQKARAATAKYQNINNAFRDQYRDINLVLPNMGYHFMKAALIDSVFDYTQPEILVYNKNEAGGFDLVAVEYAVPINPLSPNTPPAGFTGDADQWDFNTLNTGLWTLHAWIWKNNPDGVFNMTNPLVQVL